MTAFARIHLTPLTARRRVLLLGLLACTAALTLLRLATAPPASAIVETIEGTQVGLQPRAQVQVETGGAGGQFANPSGNPVISNVNTFIVYWDPTDAYHPEWQRLIDNFMHNTGDVAGRQDTVFAVDTQYTDRHNEGAGYHDTFRGAYTDTHAYPSSGNCTAPQALPHAITCLTDAQIREQLQSFIAGNGLPTGLQDVYYLLTPPGVTVCIDSASTRCSDYKRPARTPIKFKYKGKTADYEEEIFYTELLSEQVSEQEVLTFASTGYKESFCSYHSAINPGNPAEGSPSTIVYAVIPWVAGSAGERPVVARGETEWGYECQDSGVVPQGEKGEGGELGREKAKELSGEEVGTFEEANFKEKQKTWESLERETPHLQEPEQVGLGEDGMYDTGLADVIVNQLSLQQQDVITDPLLNGWQGTSDHFEASDECRNDFLTGSMQGSSNAQELTQAGTLSNQSYNGTPYYLNDAYNHAATALSAYGIPCIGGINLQPNFTAPNPVAVGEVVGFDGMESDITLNEGTHYNNSGSPEPTYAWYKWTVKPVKSETETVLAEGYAPGAPACELPWGKPCAASIYHTFEQPGEYEVSLVVRDVGGNVSEPATRTIDVVAPGVGGKSGGSDSGSGSGSGASPSSSGGSAGAGTPAVTPSPVAHAAVVSHSLSEALDDGLAVLYNVSEKVAGHFEVLLTTKVAHKLGISGPAAGDLPAGSEPQTVIARALLVTLKGGTSAVHIKFSKRTAKRLARAKKVSLELRLIVHNAAVHPASTVFTTAVTLTAKKSGKHR